MNKISKGAKIGFLIEVFDKSVDEKVYKLEAVYMKQGIVEGAATIEELAEKMNVPFETLKQSIETYNESVNGAPDPFGRNIFGEQLQEGPFYFIKVATGYLSTNGGLKIDASARVLKEDGTPIEGYYTLQEMQLVDIDHTDTFAEMQIY